jgi:hypothetical protein
MNVIDTLFLEPFKICYENIMRFLPTVLTSFVVLVLGIIVALILKVIFYRFFKILKLDAMLERSGVSGLLNKGGVKDNLSGMLSRLIGWFVFFVFCLMAINTLQIVAVGKLFESFLLYLPHFFVALIILFVGYLMSNFFYRTVLIAAVNAGNRFAGLMGRSVKYAIILLALTMAMEQLGVGKETVIITFAIIFGGIVMACAVAFGLGGRDIARRYLEKQFKGEARTDDDDEIHHI